MSPPGDWPEICLACTSNGRECQRLPAAAQVADAGCRARLCGRYTAGISADDGIGIVAALPARPLAALCAVGPDHAHGGAVLAGVRHDVGGASVGPCGLAVPHRVQ